MTFIGAHAGHWLVSLLYVAPVVVIVGVLTVQARRDRRRERRETQDR
jgi:cytochrome c-type biogenesis protein CcmH/NrfF